MAQVSMKALLETGVHFGHRTRKWNPKMREYIFTERNGIHIIDLQQTLKSINRIYDTVRDTTADGGTVLFVGTKRQAQETIAREAVRCGMPYVNERWLGGTMTNWQTIRQRIQHLEELERRRDEGEFDLLTKKEALTLEREIAKLEMRLGGIRIMKDRPNLLFVVDVTREYTAVHEANILDIPVIAMVDTNCDPDLVDLIIPSNDDAIRAIKLITSVMADAVLEGKAVHKEELVEEITAEAEEYDYEYDADDEDATDEEFLGQATLAKLKSGELSFEDEQARSAKASKAKASKAAEEDEEEEEELEEEPTAEEEPAAEEETEAEEEEAEAEDEGEEAADEDEDDESDED